MKKRILSFLMALVMVLSLVPVGIIPVETAEAADTGLSLAELQERFPHGRYWNHVGSSTMDPNKTTDTPCTHHGSCAYSGSCGCNSFQGVSIQCQGYAEHLGFLATGDNPRDESAGVWHTYWGDSAKAAIDNLKAGDIVQYPSGSGYHVIYITSVNGDTVTYTDCNGDRDGAKCGIRWDVTTSKTKLKEKNVSMIRSAPFETPSDSNTLIKDEFNSYCYVQVTADNAHVKSMPCSADSDPNSVTVAYPEKGHTFTAIGLVQNRYNNCWYKVALGNGKEGYLYAGDAKWVKDLTDDLRLDDPQDPVDMAPGGTQWLHGTVRATHSGLDKVEVSVYDSAGTWKIGASDTKIYDNEYPMNHSDVDENTWFPSLTEVGTYTYEVKAYYKNYYAKTEKTADYHTGHEVVRTSTFRVVNGTVVDYKPSQPAPSGMKSAYTLDEAVIFAWAPTTNTTHYNIWLEKKDSNGEYMKVDHIFYVTSPYALKRETGEYRAVLQSMNENKWNEAGTSHLFTESEWIYFTITPVAPTLRISTTESCGDPKLTWTAVDGAEKYEVYRATASNGTYSKVKTTTSLSYTDSSSRTAGTTYYYKVRAVTGSVYSSYSSVKSHAYVAHTYSGGICSKCNYEWPYVVTSISATKYSIIDQAGAWTRPYENNSTNKGNIPLGTVVTVVAFTTNQAGNVWYQMNDGLWVYGGNLGCATHSFSAWKVTKQPTYTATGTEKRTCSVCSYAEIRTVEKLALGVPVVTASNNISTGKPVLEWSAIKDAEKYEIWRSESKNGTYNRIYTATATQFTNTSAVAGTTYYYKVRAVKGDIYGAFGEPVRRTCDFPRLTLSVSNDDENGAVVLSWAPVEGATKYQLYRADSEEGTYTKIWTSTATEFSNPMVVKNISDLEIGKTYYYKVRALNDNSDATGVFSVPVAGVPKCAMPQLSISTTKSCDNPKLTWAAVDGAEKYEVYRATASDGTYTKLATTTAPSYTDNSSRAIGTTYYYKVRAVTGSTYSSYSSVKNHTYAHTGLVTDPAVAATCIAAGLTEGQHCTACGTVIVAQTVIEPLAHFPVDGFCIECGEVLLAAPTVKISVDKSCGNPKLTWTAVEGADYYVVCRSVERDNGVVRLTTTTELSYIDSSTSRKLGTLYLYEVRAVKGNIDGVMSEEVGHRYAHTLVTDPAVAATCTTTGLTEGQHCSACGEVTVAQTVVPALGHDNVNGSCSRCGDSTAIPGDFTDDGLVTNEDVSYLLWHTLFPADYPITNEGDFDGDSAVTNEDVVYLLWHTLFPEDYPLQK